MKAALFAVALGLAACAHAPTLSDALAKIDTSQFALPTARGQTFALADQRGRVVVMEFLGTWCVPCLAEVNQLEKLPARFPGVEVVGVALDPDAALTAPAFIETTGVSFPILIADEATRNGRGPFGRIPELPTTAIVDAHGVVRDAFTGLIPDADLDRLVRDAKSR